MMQTDRRQGDPQGAPKDDRGRKFCLYFLMQNKTLVSAFKWLPLVPALLMLGACSMNRAAPEYRERLNHHNPLGAVERGVGGH